MKKAQNFGKWLYLNVNKLIIKANLHPFSIKEGVSGRKVEPTYFSQVFRKYLLKVTTHEMTSWGVIPVLLSLCIAFKEDTIFWKNLFIIVQLLVPVIPKDGLPAAL